MKQKFQRNFCFTSCHLKVALGPHEISAKFRVAEKKLGWNSTAQINRWNFCMSREFAGGATLRWHSLQTGDSYNLDVPNFVAARFWPVFAPWPSFRRNFGHGLCHLKVAPGSCEISLKFRVAPKKNRPKFDRTSWALKFLCESRVCRWCHLKVVPPANSYIKFLGIKLYGPVLAKKNSLAFRMANVTF